MGSVAPLPFTDVLATAGSGFNTNRSTFVVPESGVYFLSFSVGAAYGSPVEANLVVGVNPVIGITRQSTVHTGKYRLLWVEISNLFPK